MPRILIPYLLWWVRLYYRIGHGLAHWFLRIIPMPSALRHRLADAVVQAHPPQQIWDQNARHQASSSPAAGGASRGFGSCSRWCMRVLPWVGLKLVLLWQAGVAWRGFPCR